MEVYRKPDGKLGEKVLGDHPGGEGRVQGAQGRAAAAAERLATSL